MTTKLKTKLDIELLIKTIKMCDDQQLKQIVKEYRNGEFLIV